MIKTIITCDRCGLIMAQVDANCQREKDRLIDLAERCGHSIDAEDICRVCNNTSRVESCRYYEPSDDDAITKEIVIPKRIRDRKC